MAGFWRKVVCLSMLAILETTPTSSQAVPPLRERIALSFAPLPQGAAPAEVIIIVAFAARAQPGRENFDSPWADISGQPVVLQFRA
jgi:hypothetical protein